MVQFDKTCAYLIAKCAKESGSHIFLPSDICYSVIDSFKIFEIPYSFYPVLRNWTEVDNYDFKNVGENNIILVSDLFNFRSINLDQLEGYSIYLDLAHCSIETSNWYLNKSSDLNINILDIFISFGRGKYYRFGGGGLSFQPKDINTLNIFCDFEYGLKDIPLKILEKGIFNKSSTRIIIPSNFIEDDEIQLMRKSGIDISDSLFDNLYDRPFTEYIVWKTKTQKII